MARINSSKAKTLKTVDIEALTTNYEGAVAYKLAPKQELVERVLGALWNEDSYYAKGRDNSSAITALVKTVAKSDPKFPLQLAAYARNVIYLRTTPQVLLVEAANINECKPFVRQYVPKIVKRADELADVISYQLSTHGHPIPNSLKKGLADAFSKFDEYQLNKYDSSKRSVSLGDVLKLIDRKKDWPVSKAMREYLVNDVIDEEALPKIAALKKLLASDTLDMDLLEKSGATWENVISKFGSTKETWMAVYPKMGYMAKLRNLRNFLEKSVPLNQVITDITDERAIKNSKQLPYRFYSAYKQVKKSQLLSTAVSRAFEASASNAKFDGVTCVMIDLSGSMHSPVSAKSDIEMYEIGSLLGALAVKKSEESLIIVFGSDARLKMLNPDDTMLTNMEKIGKTNVGYATNAHLAFERLLQSGKKVDRILLISDMQCYDSTGKRPSYYESFVNRAFNSYLNINPNTILYSFDLSAYGTKQTAPSKDKNVVLLNGWSDKVLDYINLSEKGIDVMEQEIKKW